MNFSEWLRVIEEANRATPSQGVLRGPEGTYGPRALLPVDATLNNRAVASLVGGIGAANAKILARKGAEPGQVPQFDKLDDIRRSMLKAIYMPLQLPIDYDENAGQTLYSGRSTMNMARGVSQKPLDDSGIWRVDENNPTSIIGGGSGMKTKLFTYDTATGAQHNSAAYQSAVNFTEALMKVGLMSRTLQYSHVLNVENPVVKDRQEFPTDWQGQQSHLIMMCSFTVSPKNKDSDIGGQDWHDIADQLSGGANKKQTSQGPRQAARQNAARQAAVPNAAGAANVARRRAQATAARRQAQPSATPQTGPVTP